MDKKLFAELMEGANQMAGHAAGKKVKGVREVVKEVKSLKPLSKEDIVNLRKEAACLTIDLRRAAKHKENI